MLRTYVIIPAGLEKLIPGCIVDSVQAAGRKSIDVAYGMAVGLVPIIGRVVTELDAIQTFGKVQATVIGRGGLGEAAGATTMVIKGEDIEVKRVLQTVDRIRDAITSAEEDSFLECKRGSPGCANHLACTRNLRLKYLCTFFAKFIQKSSKSHDESVNLHSKSPFSSTPFKESFFSFFFG